MVTPLYHDFDAFENLNAIVPGLDAHLCWPSYYRKALCASKLMYACILHSLLLDGRMFPYSVLSNDKQWQPGPYEGVELMVLHKNETTGGVTVLRKFKQGVTVPAHIHPEANESVYVLSGEWDESGTVFTNGAFFFAPKGRPHGPHIARTEVISLTMFDGPLTVVPA